MVLKEKKNNNFTAADVTAPSFAASYDVVVTGLGPAGSLSLITAAKKGLKVLGIERLNCMGGMGTAGAVFGYYFGNRGGEYEQIDEESRALNGSVYAQAGLAFGGESKKTVLEKTALSYGAQICYEALCTGIYMEGNRVCGVKYFCPEGEISVSCKVLIDATGDAYACEMAGCETVWGREIDGMTQPFTGVRVYIDGDCIRNTNHDCGVVDQRSSVDLSKSILSANGCHYDREKVDGSTFYAASILGIRDGKRIVGQEMPVVEELFADQATKEPVFYAYADLDKHGLDYAFEDEPMQDWWMGANLGAVNVTVPISINAHIPKGIEGILAAGRCISMDINLQSCVRMLRDMQKSGEAAATAAKIAIDRGCSLKDIPYDQLKEQLLASGCLSEANNKKINFESSRPSCTRAVVWLTDEAQIRAGLDSDSPGVSIWSAYRLKMADSLAGWLTAESEMLRKHAAFALGLLKDARCIPVLREIVTERDVTLLADCRKNNQRRMAIATFLLGKLGDEGIVDTLISILSDDVEIARGLRRTDEFIGKSYLCNTSDAYVYFQISTQAIRALNRIGNKFPARRSEILRAFDTYSEKYLKAIEIPQQAVYFSYIFTQCVPGVLERTRKQWNSK